VKFEELKNKDSKSLIENLSTLKREMFNLRMQKAQGSLEKPSRLRECRRDYARVKAKLAQLKSA
jgi:large subunit ribosomal protein L29